MKTRACMGVMATGAALVVLLPALAESPLVQRAPATAAAAAPAGSAPAVRVEHELVAPTVVEERIAERVQRRASISPAPGSAKPPAARPGFASRTRRLLLGDGRYRPEPFPRAGH